MPPLFRNFIRESGLGDPSQYVSRAPTVKPVVVDSVVGGFFRYLSRKGFSVLKPLALGERSNLEIKAARRAFLRLYPEQLFGENRRRYTAHRRSVFPDRPPPCF